MKTHFRCAAAVFMLASVVLVYFNKIEALLSSAIGLQIFSLTESEAGWTQRFKLSAWREALSARYPVSMIGAVCGYGAIVLLLSYLAISAWL